MSKKTYVFLHTVKEEGRERLRALPGQKDRNGQAVIEDLNVQANMEMRKAYPLGTVFGTETLETRTSGSSKPFYNAGEIFPVGLTPNDYVSTSHLPPQDMDSAYSEYRQTHTPAAVMSSSGKAAGKPKNLLQMLSRDPQYAAPTVDTDGFYINSEDWLFLMRNIIAKHATLLTGPTGTGKTELVMLACRKLGLDCHVYDMGSMLDPISGLLGTHRLIAGGSVFDYAKFTQDIQKPGVILLDELSRAPANCLNILFPCLDSRRALPVEMAGGNDMRSIPVHPDCVFFATANIGAEYTGTDELDKALTNRFILLELGYMPKDCEQNVLRKRAGIDVASARNIAAAADTIRNRHREGDLSTEVSTRETLAAARMVADGWSAAQAMKRIFLPLFEGTNIEGERSIVSKIIMAY